MATRHRHSTTCGRHDGRVVTRHCDLRWKQRTPPTAVGLRQAWDEAVPVGSDDVYGQCRLYEPFDVLIVVADGAFKTVKYVNDLDLNDDHLVECDECGYRFHPGQSDGCHWCGATR